MSDKITLVGKLFTKERYEKGLEEMRLHDLPRYEYILRSKKYYNRIGRYMYNIFLYVYKEDGTKTYYFISFDSTKKEKSVSIEVFKRFLHRDLKDTNILNITYFEINSVKYKL